MRTIETQIFTFKELSNAAKEKAREWYRAGNCEDAQWADFVIEDAEQIASLLGIEFDQREFKTMGGGSGSAPNVYWSGFWSQGDGACFEGVYRYKKGAIKAVKDYAPQDEKLHRIAQALQDVQKRHFYKLVATCKHRGHYSHSGCMSIDIEHDEDRYRDVSAAGSDLEAALRRFADWIYAQLEKEWGYQNADEQVDESIIANGYEFTADGVPA